MTYVRSHRILAIAALSVSTLLSASARGQASYAGGQYLQNFDGLPSSGTSLTFTGSAFYDLGSISSSLAGVQISRNASATGTTALAVSNGASNSGAIFSFGATGDSNRALGSVASNSSPGAASTSYWYYGIALTNNSGATLNTFSLSYDGEQWRNGGNTAVQSLAFSYNVGASGLSVASAGFVPVSSLNFNSLQNTTVAAALDGTAAGNRTAGITASISGLTWNPGDTLVLRWADVNDAGNDHGLAIDNVTFSATGSTFAPRSLTYTGAQSNDFDLSHANFTDGTSAVAYAESPDGSLGDSVSFTGAAPGVVAIQASGVSPANVAVASDANYTFSGGPIKGNAGIQKSGAGTLTLASTNTFSGGAGGIVVSGGTLEVANAQALGSSGVTVSSGARLQFDVSATLSALHLVDDAGAEVNVATGATATVASATGGVFTDPYALTKTGGGTLAFSSTFPSDAYLLTIAGGAVQLNQASGTTNIFIASAWGGTTAGDLVLNGAFRVNLKSNLGGTDVGAPGTTGRIVLAAPSLGISSSQLASVQANVGSIVNLNVGVFLGGSSSADRFALGAGSGAGGTLVLDAPITGTGSLFFASQKVASGSTNYISGGTGTVELHAPSTFAGDAYVALATGGVVRAFVDNALPATATLHFGDDNLPASSTSGTNTTTFSIGALDLNGHALTLRGIASSAAPAVAIGGLTNSSGSASTVTLVGSASSTYGGPIADHINLLADSTFTGTQTLMAALSTTSTLSAAGGRIILAPAGGTVGHVGTLATSGAGTIQLAPTSPQQLLVASALAISGGTLDLTTNDLVVHGSSAAAVAALLGHGLTSSIAGTGAGRDLYAGLAIVDNVDGQGNALYSTFDGEPVSASDVLVKYTYVGDTDLNGYVDANDLANLLVGLNGGLTGWVNGDLNYDGHVDAIDYNLLLNSLANETTSFGNSAGHGGAVPEPTSLALVAAGLPVLGRRRRA